MPVGDIVKVNVVGAMHGQRTLFGWHMRFATTAATMGDLATDVLNNIIPSLLPAVTQDLGILAIEVADVRKDGPETVEHTVTGNLVGEFVSPSAPPTTAAVCSLHTGIKGKRYRGRFYVPALPAEFCLGGRLTGEAYTNMQVFADTIDTRYGDTGNNPAYRAVVYSPEDLTYLSTARGHKGEPRPRAGTIISQVTRLTVDPVLRVQRRRELGVGA